MATFLPWWALYELDFTELDVYIDAWKTTNDGMEQAVEDVDDKVQSSLEAAFGDLEGNFSAGATAAMEKAESMAEHLGAAHIEGKAIHEVLVDVMDELKRQREKFRELVDEINDTRGPLSSDGKFTVDLNEMVVKHPPDPDLSHVKDQIDKPDGGWDNADSALSIWRGVCNEMILAWEEELDNIAGDAYDADQDAARLLNGISANDTKSFNADAGDAVAEASIKEQEADAAEVEERLNDGEVTEKDIKFANDKMEKHAGSDHFSTKLMNELGPEGLINVYGQASATSPAGEEEMADFQKNLGTTLAGATDPSNDTHVGDKWVEDLQNAGGEQQEFEDAEGNTYSAAGYQVMAPMLEHGEYSEEFLVPVAEDMIQMDASGYGWSTVDAGGETGQSNPFNQKHPGYVNPVNSLLVGLGHSPEASAELFTTDPEKQEDRDYYGNDTVVPDDYMEYLLNRETMDGGPEDANGNPIALDEAPVTANSVGAAIESAATGASYDNPPDPPPEHTKQNVAVTEKLMGYVNNNPDDFKPDGHMSDMTDNLGDITVSYIADVYQAEAGEPPAESDWMPKSHGEALEADKADMDQFLNVVGTNPDAAMNVAIASEMTGTAAMEGKYEVTQNPDKTMDALVGHTETIAALHHGGVDQIIADYEAQDKAHNDKVDQLSGTVKTVTGAGIMTDNPLAGGLLRQGAGDAIDGIAEEFKVDSSDLAESDVSGQTLDNGEAVENWAYGIYYELWADYAEKNPDEPGTDVDAWVREFALDSAERAREQFETKAGLNE